MTVRHADSARLKRFFDSEHALSATSFHSWKCSPFGIGLASTVFRLYVAWASPIVNDRRLAAVAKKTMSEIGFILLSVTPRPT